jgi:hypothetical protein
MDISLECGALAPLWPKRRQAAALQGTLSFVARDALGVYGHTALNYFGSEKRRVAINDC